MKKAFLFLAFIAICSMLFNRLWLSESFAQTQTSQTLDTNNNFTGSNTFTGLFSATGGGSLSGKFGGNPVFTGNATFSHIDTAVLSSIVVADQQTGADCGAKIDAASGALGGPGTIWVSQRCGSLATAVNIAFDYQTIEFIQGGTYEVGAPITISGLGSGIQGAPCSESDISNAGHTCAVFLHQANRANLRTLITLSGPQSFVYWVTADGNKANNSNVATTGVKMTGNRSEITSADVQNFHGKGIDIDGSPAPPGSGGCDGVNYCKAEGANLNHVQSAQNDSDCLNVQNQTDTFAHFSKFENCGGWGAKVINGTFFADSWTDFGGNALGGATCVTTSTNFNVWCALIFNGFTAGNNAGPAIFQSGWNGSTIANGATQIQNGSVANSGTLGTNADLLHFEDVSGILVSGLKIQCVGTSNCRYGFSLINNATTGSTGSFIGNHVTGNFTNANSAALGNNIPINLGTTATVLFLGNNENGASQYSLTNARLLNNNPLWCTNASARVEACMFLDGRNHLNILGDSGGNEVLLLPDGSTRLGFTNTQSSFPAGWRMISPLFGTSTNCSSTASPAVCGAAGAGSVAIAPSSSSVVVDTSAVTANSQIIVTYDSSLSTKLSVTCNNNAQQPYVSARSAGVSFTISTASMFTTDPGCISYQITN